MNPAVALVQLVGSNSCADFGSQNIELILNLQGKLNFILMISRIYLLSDNTIIILIHQPCYIFLFFVFSRLADETVHYKHQRM